MSPDLSAALRPIARRVRARWLLEWVRRGALVGLSAATAAVLAGRLIGLPDWPLALLLLAAPLGGAGVALARLPGPLEAARAADSLGLAERATSALHAAQTGHPAALLLLEDARRALARVEPADYALIPRPRAWLGVPIAGLLLAGAALAPLPTLGDGARRAEEARAVAETRRSVESLQARLPEELTVQPLVQRTDAELEALDEELARAKSVAEAAAALERAQEKLASAAQGEDFAWRRAIEALAAEWAGRPDLGGLAAALQGRDPQAVEQALAELAERSARGEAADEEALRLALQAGANRARDVPALAAALRQAAQAGAGEAGAGDDSSGDETAEALRALAPLLAQGAGRSAGLQATQQALADLGEARAALGAAGSGAGGAQAAAGAPSGSGGQAAGGSGQVGEASAGAGSGQASGSSGSGSGAGAGDASGNGTGDGDGSGSGSGSGSGTGTGSGSSSGIGSGSGSGSGAGAGAGGGPAPGKPGSGNAGATTAGGTAAPSDRGATTYDPVYAPSLLGGEGGPRVGLDGDASDAGGPTVELPDSPLTTGAIRPYDEVYGQYEAAARQSLSRQAIPPALQGTIQRYFSAIAPEAEPTD